MMDETTEAATAMRFWADIRRDAAERMMAAPDRWQEFAGLWTHGMHNSNACALQLGLVEVPGDSVQEQKRQLWRADSIDFYDSQTIIQKLEQDIKRVADLLRKLDSLEKEPGG